MKKICLFEQIKSQLIFGGGHTWPGAGIPIAGSNTNQDFNASEKIWEFFSKYDLNGLISTTNLIEPQSDKTIIKTIDILGKESTKNGFFIEIYNDGSTNKKYKF